MGERELQEALRSKARAQIRHLWLEAEEAVAAARAATDAKVRALQQDARSRVAASVAASRHPAQAVSARAARQQRLRTETALQERMYALALRLLLAPADTGQRRRRWLALTAELPAAEWRRILVHPDDLAVARETFPNAEVTSDAKLLGGVVAETGDGRFSVDNSLAGRLARAWPELQAPLFAAINEKVDTDAAGPAAAD